MADARERVTLLERYHPYWPHSFRGETPANIARFAHGLLEGDRKSVV